jgi:hypothetical protein
MHNGAPNTVNICPLRSKKCNEADIRLAKSKQSGAKKYYNKIFEGYFLQKQTLEL